MTLAGTWVFHGEKIQLAHLWSLAVEEQFYLVWPFVVLLLSARTSAKMCLALVLLSCALRTAMNSAGMQFGAITLMPTRSDALAVGAFAAIAQCCDVGRVTRIGMLGAIALDVALVAVVGGQRAVLPLVLGCGLVLLAIHYHWSWLSWRPLAILGRYSYGLYLYHYAILPAFEPSSRLVRALAAHVPMRVAAGSSALAGMAVSLALAVVSWRLVEVRFLKMKANLPAADARVTIAQVT